MPPTHEDLVDLWAAASGDLAWRAQVQALAASHRQLLLAIADARYVDGEDDARRSRTTYAALSRDVDPSSPVDVRRVHRLFEGPFDGGWPLELMHRGFRHAVDRETELRCGTLCAQQLVVDGAVDEGIAVVGAILDRIWGSGIDAEAAALVILSRALMNETRFPEALDATRAAAAWTASRPGHRWEALARLARVETLLSLRATEEAAAALVGFESAVAAAPADRRADLEARRRGLEAGVQLFRGDVGGALATLAAANAAWHAGGGSGREPGPFIDLEVEALRRAGRAAEGRGRLAAALAEAARAPSPHHRTLDAALAASLGDFGPAFAWLEAAVGSAALSAGGRLVALTYLLDACGDVSAALAFAAEAGPALASAIATRVDQVAAHRGAFPALRPATPEDHAVLARRIAPDGPRETGAWAVASAALAASNAYRAALRLDHARPVVCRSCGAVDTLRHGWIPVRTLLPFGDDACSGVARCPGCPGG
ncbi:MAG: hypothetical protein U1E39_05835 [Planctomycetota bacterium]